MLHQTYLTDWHQLFLVAAGFLTAILLVWAQHWQRSFYAEKDCDKRCEQDRRFSNNIAGLWLFVGELFALLAFGLTGLDWLFTRQSVPLCPVACQMGQMQRLAAGFLMSAFIIALIAVMQQIFNAGQTLVKKGKAEPIVYGRDFIERRYNKRCLFIAVCIALFLVFVSCLLPALIPPDCWTPIWWLWLALFSFLIPLFIVGGTYKYISRQRSRKDPCVFRDFIMRLYSKCRCIFRPRSSQDP